MPDQTLRTLPLSTHLDDFLLDCQARRLSPGTLRYYREKLTAFVRFAVSNGAPTPADLSASLCRRYLVSLQNRELAPMSQHAHARALRAFGNWLVAEDVLAESPMRRVQMPQLDKRLPTALTEGEVKRLLAATSSQRDRALVLFLLDTGVRARECLSLAIADVDLTTGAVRVASGKGNKERIVYLGAHARRALARYLRSRLSVQPADALWVSQRDGQPLHLAGLRQILRRLGESAGVQHCHPHIFRRTFALWSLRAGMNIYALQQLMGHADLTVLRRYLALTETDLSLAHQQHGPVNSHL